MEKKSGDTEMSDAFADDNAVAKGLIQLIAGDAWEGKTAAMETVYSVLAAMFPKSNWTRRRVKGLYQGEAANVAFREMRELAEAARSQRQKHEKIRKAREQHAEFIAETTRLASMALGRKAHRSRNVAAQ